MTQKSTRIPKIIHYCWFGHNPEPKLMQKCIESWRKHLPDYKLILWNEENFDVNSNRFTKEAYQEKKWAFVSDYVRLYALEKYGGIYMDTDMEILRSLTPLLNTGAFAGYENDIFISTGIIGAQKGHRWITELLKYYKDRPFVNSDGTFNTTPNPVIVTKITQKKFAFDRSRGFQVLCEGLTIYPKEYFCPKNYYDNSIELMPNSYAIHHFSGSWHTSYERIKLKLHRFFILLFGRRLHNRILRKRHLE